MSSLFLRVRVKKLPIAVKRWLEKELDRKVLQNEELSASVMKKLTKKESQAYRQKWDKEKAQRSRSLNVVARKMIKLGMSKQDAQTVRSGGYNT